jgi:hypothetical protein
MTQDAHTPVDARRRQGVGEDRDHFIDHGGGDRCQGGCAEALTPLLDPASGLAVAAMVDLGPGEILIGELAEGTAWHLPFIEILPLRAFHQALFQDHLGQLLIRADALALAQTANVIVNLVDPLLFEYGHRASFPGAGFAPFGCLRGRDAMPIPYRCQRIIPSTRDRHPGSGSLPMAAILARSPRRS